MVSDEAPRDPWAVVPVEDWLGEEPIQRSMLLPDFLRGPGAIVIISGQQKRTFKSTFAGVMATAVAAGGRGTKFQGEPIGRAIIFMTEGSESENKIRQNAIQTGLGLQRETFPRGQLFVKYAPGLFKLNTEVGALRILEQVERIKPVVVVLDSWTYFINGDENDHQCVLPAINTVQKIQAMGVTVIIVAHLSKQAGENPRADLDTQLRGSSLLANIYDDHFALRKYDGRRPLVLPLTWRSRFAAERKFVCTWQIVEDARRIPIESRVDVIEVGELDEIEAKKGKMER